MPDGPKADQSPKRCSACGAEIYWASVPQQDGTMKRLPVNKTRVRGYLPNPDGTWRRSQFPFYVGHHLTCPDRGKFKK